MSFLISPVATTPLLKVPLLLAYGVCTWEGLTPPQPPPSKKEQDRLNRSGEVILMTIPVAFLIKSLLCILAVAEAVLLLATYLPPTSHLQFSPAFTRTLGFDLAGLIGFAVGIMGGGLRMWCHRSLGRFFVWHIAVHDAHELVTTGPYAFARHPSYTGFILMTAGSALLYTSPCSLFVASGFASEIAGQTVASASVVYLAWISVMLLFRMGREDVAMRREFGDKWEEWARKTPYKLVPGIF